MSSITFIYDNYGGKHQLDKLIEELQEALIEAVKLKGLIEETGSDIDADMIEPMMRECADVEVVTEQFMGKFGLISELESYKEYKIERQLRRIKESK